MPAAANCRHCAGAAWRGSEGGVAGGLPVANGAALAATAAAAVAAGTVEAEAGGDVAGDAATPSIQRRPSCSTALT